MQIIFSKGARKKQRGSGKAKGLRKTMDKYNPAGILYLYNIYNRKTSHLTTKGFPAAWLYIVKGRAIALH